MSNIKPENTYTIEDFISLQSSDKLTYYNYSILQKSIFSDRIEYSTENVVHTYLDELKDRQQLVVLTKPEIIKYRYKPKLFSYDIYGSTELFFVILALNGMCSAKQFNLYNGTVYALFPADMEEYMTTIYNAELDYIKINRAKLREESQ